MEYKLEDLINIPAFQSLQEKLYKISAIPTGIIDNEGKILTAVAWQDLCTQFYRKHPECEKACIKSDQYILDHLHEANPSVSYKCPHGLIDTATPIIVEGKHLANYFIGQFFMAEPDLELYRRQAQKYGFKEDAFIEAVKQVPIWSDDQLTARLEFVKEFIDVITTAGLRQLKELEINRVLKESEERFKSIVESTDDFIWTVDPVNFRIKTFNHALNDYFISVHGKELTIGETIESFAAEKTNEWLGIYRKTLELGKYETEYEVRTGNKYLYLSLNTIKIGKELYAISIFGKDISGMKQYQQELIAAKERAERNERQLKESQIMAKLGSWEFDFNRSIFTFTDNFYKIFKTTAEEVGGYEMAPEEYTQRFVHPEDSKSVGDEVLMAIKTNDPDYTRYIEHRILYKDGSMGYIGVRFFINKDIHGRTVKSYGVIQDITDKKISERELIAAKEKAEESNRLKSAFLMNMSHEIRTPMNGILGFMNLLNDPDLSEKDRHEYVSLINVSGDRLMNTINDLIEISRIEIGDINVRNDLVDLNELMQFYYNFFKRETDEKGLKLVLEDHIKGEEAQLITDRHKLDGILMNLIKNAVKFTVKGTVKIGNRLVNGKLLLYVADTGRGIPGDKFDSIFDRFVQVDLGGNRDYEGSGLGLSIVKGYVEALNGSIEIESAVGKGSTFYITLPYKQVLVKPEVSSKSLSLNRPSDRITILIAEDDEINNYLLKKILSNDFNIIHASNGSDAVNLFKEHPEISIILMDIKMPGKFDGLEATRRIRKLNKYIPIIAQTAFAMHSDKERALNAGCTDLITKPFNKTGLLTLIANYLDNPGKETGS